MTGGILVGIEAAQTAAGGALSLGKGAIIGAMLISAAFLAGMAVLRKSAAAFCGFLMLVAAGALQATWLGIGPAPSPTMSLLLQGLFAASALIFLSAAIGMATRSQLIGGLLFAGALSMIGIGVINALLGGEAAGLQRTGMIAVACVAIVMSAFAGARGDLGARLILPGAALAAAAPLLFQVSGASGALSLAPQAVFAIGVLLASIVALTDAGAAPSGGGSPDLASVAQFSGENRASFAPAHRHEPSRGEALKVSENQLAQVLDYSGIAVWDWSRTGGHQTASFAALMGADSDGAFTPEAFRAFVHSDDVVRFDEKIYGAAEGDGGFDEMLKLQSGKRVRARGARAVDPTGSLERIVVFIEDAACAHDAAKLPHREDALKLAAASLTGAVAATARSAATTETLTGRPAPSHPIAKAAALVREAPQDNIVAAIDRGDIVAAFQPIVSFETGKTCGAEALVRWPASGESSEQATADIVRKAQLAGKGRALASLMLKAAARQACERIAAGDKKYFAAFNVSLSQIRDEAFIEDVRLAIGDHKLPPGALVLELTEGERLADTPKINDTFKKLRAAGAALAYDDFGAGFSSLSNLHKYDFDYLKIDKSFIDDIVANGGKKKIVAALARLGRDFDMTVIAEGVETKAAAEVAKAIGCRMGQGFYLGAPKLDEKPAPAGVGAAASAELATIEVMKPGAVRSDMDDKGEIVLERSMEADKPQSRAFRRRLFGKR
jgi:EAL domain-containing protein (putative c-di-GMP-specific phosphodiesterase class I)